jgi:putative ABC transport system ATP-binding protein
MDETFGHSQGKIQRAIGTLSKIAEERLSNVKTSQSFAGEILEVHRYNTQARKIFNLGKREAFVSATFFGTVGISRSSLMYGADVRRLV